LSKLTVTSGFVRALYYAFVEVAFNMVLFKMEWSLDGSSIDKTLVGLSKNSLYVRRSNMTLALSFFDPGHFRKPMANKASVSI